jgi:hypothetical protein
MFFGGHVNVFQPLVRAHVEAGEHMRYIDITSHCPNICAHYPLCTGHPQRLLGPEIDRARSDPRHPNPYFGFFRGVLHMPPDDMYGGLPYRDARGTVIFDNKAKLVGGFLPELYERLASWDRSLRSSTFQDPNVVQARSVGMSRITTGTRWKQAGGRV